MSLTAADSSRLSRAWIADVLCGAVGGWIALGQYGLLAGALFMATAGHVFRLRRLRREAQLRDIRVRARLRQRAGARAVAMPEGASSGV